MRFHLVKGRFAMSSSTKEGIVLDLKRVTAEVAARHGMLVRPDDPAMLLVTMNEVVLQQLAADIEARVMETADSLVSVLRSTQVEASKGIESEARKAGIAVRE